MLVVAEVQQTDQQAVRVVLAAVVPVQQDQIWQEHLELQTQAAVAVVQPVLAQVAVEVQEL